MKWLIPLLALVAMHASAETTTGPAITALPYTINKGGVYHLTKNLAYSPAAGAAITVNNPQVVIDMNGYEIECISGTTNTAICVSCPSANRVTVKNGTITGFHTGISFASNGATVSGMILTGNYAAGIAVTGNNIQITKNRVFNTGGSPSATERATGIAITGTDCTITDNDVNSTFIADLANHSAVGIRLTNCTNLYFADNHVLDTEPAAPANATSTGIGIVTSQNLVILGNTVITAEVGFDLSGGASGEYGENTTTNDGVSYNTNGSGMTAIPNSNN